MSSRTSHRLFLSSANRPATPILSGLAPIGARLLFVRHAGFAYCEGTAGRPAAEAELQDAVAAA